MVLEEDEKVLQTGQTFEAIDSDTMVQLEVISSVELRSEWATNFTINLHFLPEGRVVFSVFWDLKVPAA